MAVKNAIYNVNNGTGYDEIHFKTSAGQIFFIDGKTLSEFLQTDGEAVRLKKDRSNYVSVDATATRFFNSFSSDGTRYTSIAMDSNGHSQIYSNTTMLKLLGGGQPSVQARWAGDSGYCQMAASEFRVGSLKAYKENIHEPIEIDFIKVLMENDIKAYNLVKEVEHVNETIPGVFLANGKNSVKARLKVGLILDDLTEEAKMILTTQDKDDTVALYPMISALWKVCQEQQKAIGELNKKLEQLHQV